jgi:two-component system, cell cycle sensor histidine kinase and response regulator CckA
MSDAEKSKTILVVDDEPEIRKLVCAMIGHFGYTALTANGGQRALAVYKKHHGPIDLLITDVVMKGMGGPVLADKLTQLQHGLKVLYMSGYDHSRVVQKYVVEKGHFLLAKPFTAHQMEMKLKELLAPAARTAP